MVRTHRVNFPELHAEEPDDYDQWMTQPSSTSYDGSAGDNGITAFTNKLVADQLQGPGACEEGPHSSCRLLHRRRHDNA
jgi:hypothetical protein